jgi:hypothetical protein
METVNKSKVNMSYATAGQSFQTYRNSFEMYGTRKLNNGKSAKGIYSGERLVRKDRSINPSVHVAPTQV